MNENINLKVLRICKYFIKDLIKDLISDYSFGKRSVER